MAHRRVRGAGEFIWRWAGRGAKRAAGSARAKLGPIVAGWLPVALALATFAAVVPVVAVVAMAVRRSVVPLVRRQGVDGRRLAIDAAFALGAGLAVQASAAGAVPAVGPTLATAAVVVAFLDRPTPTVAGRWARCWPFAWIGWLVAAAGIAALVLHGPWWAPLS